MESTHSMELEIITPDASAFKDSVKFVLVRATDGDFGVLPGHYNTIAALSTWPVKVTRLDGSEYFLAVFGGFMEVTPTKVTILTSNCELPEVIDVERAKRSKERAEARLADKQAHIDVARAEASLRRSLTRLRASGQIGMDGR